MHSDKECPEEHHERQVLGNGQFLESIGVWNLGDQDTEIKECTEIVELLTGKVVILDDAQNT